MERSPHRLSVTELTALIQSALQEQFGVLHIEGELSNFRPASSGHWYFALKDRDALVQCVMFRSSAARCTFVPQDGMMLRVSGNLSVYPPRGTYQIVVTTMDRGGTGEILQMLQERKERLAREGLFRRQQQDHKLPLPTLPATVAVVTSPTGAALRDIIQILRRRAPGIVVRVLPAAVQGVHAGQQIAAMIRLAGSSKAGEVVIVTRGGGSLEDLLPFSDEAVVRAISECPLPVISAVGHETDWSLADLAADYRAPTPSAAAEVVSPSREDLSTRVKSLHREITRAVQSLVTAAQRRMTTVSTGELLYRYRNLVQPWHQRLDDAAEGISRGIGDRQRDRRHRLDRAAEAIAARDPLQPLQGGFALVRHSESRGVITSAAELPHGTPMTLQFHDGTVPAIAAGHSSTDVSTTDVSADEPRHTHPQGGNRENL